MMSKILTIISYNLPLHVQYRVDGNDNTEERNYENHQNAQPTSEPTYANT